MKKPEKFEQLPYVVQESILWNCKLEYDHYESSDAETVHDILCNYPYKGSRNDLVIKSAYEAISERDLKDIVLGHISGLKSQIEQLEKLLEGSES